MTGQSATMMHPERWQKVRSAITAPFAERRPCYPVVPVDSRRVIGLPTNVGQHAVSYNSFESYNSYHSHNSYSSATLAPFDRYRTACQ